MIAQFCQIAKLVHMKQILLILILHYALFKPRWSSINSWKSDIWRAILSMENLYLKNAHGLHITVASKN